MSFYRRLFTKINRVPAPSKLMFASIACLTPGQDTTESGTQHVYRGTLPPNDHIGERTLMGVGLRTVTFAFKAYSIALYIDSTIVKRCPESMSVEDLIASSPQFTIKILAARPTSLEHIKGALGRSLRRCLPEISDVEQRNLAESELEAFLADFPTFRIAMNTGVEISRGYGDEIILSCEAITMYTVKSKWIGDTLLHVYLDKDKTKVPSLREDLEDSLSK